MKNLPIVVQDLIGEYNVEHREKMQSVFKELKYFNVNRMYCDVSFKTREKRLFYCHSCLEDIDELYRKTDLIMTFIIVAIISTTYVLYKIYLITF